VQSLVGEWLGSPCVLARFFHFSLIGIVSPSPFSLFLSFLLSEISSPSPARAEDRRERAPIDTSAVWTGGVKSI
jgi:hypothetical protein